MAKMENNTINVLLVDDDPEYVSVTKHYLRPFQDKRFDLTWVNNGEKALDFLKANPNTDLILMDYYLEKGTGLEVSKRIISEKITVPIILLTTNKDLKLAIEALKFGIEDYLVKEETVDTMLPRAIINVLERVHLKKRIVEAESEKLLSQRKAEAIQELVVTMCHEFNNPLAAIKISADILARQNVTEEEQQFLNRLNTSIALLEQQIIKLRDMNMEKRS
ncbi:MAG: response regulator [Ignavibacteriae bacterium]|nr:response regulator [Ignavibacteriota bacterium]